MLAAWICFLGGFFVLYQFLIQGSTSLMIHPLMENLCLNLAQIGFLSSAFFYPYILLQIPSGFLIDRFGPKKTLLTATLLLSIGTLTFSFSDSFVTANITRVLMGVASAPGVACALYLAAVWFPKRFSIVAGLIEMMGMLGGAVGDYFLELCICQYGWRMAMMICAIIGFMLALLILVFVRVRRQKNAPDCSGSPQNAVDVPGNMLASFIRLLKNMELWKHCLFGGCVFVVISAFASLWSIGFLQVRYPNHLEAAAFATAFIFIGAAVGAGLSGFLANRYRIKRIMQGFSIFTLALFIVLLYVPVSFGFANVLLCFLGVGSGVYILPFASVEAIADQRSQGVAMGFTNMMIIGLGGPILQPVIGAILARYQTVQDCEVNTLASFQMALLPLLICLILAVILSFSVKSRCS